MREQRNLVLDSAAIADERAVRANDAVAWNDKANRVPPHRAANCLGGHFLQSPLFRDSRRDFAVGCCLAERDLQQDVYHVLPKRRQAVDAVCRREARRVAAPSDIIIMSEKPRGVL